VYLVVDDEDPTLPAYRAQYGDMVQTFSKRDVVFDLADNFGEPYSGVVWARNACTSIAKRLGVRYFIQLDDDYTRFEARIDSAGQYVPQVGLRDLDKIWGAMLAWMIAANLDTVAMSQGGDWIGGSGEGKKTTTKPWYRQNGFAVRKAMNSFICDAQQPVPFLGRINEDVNSYVVHGARGRLLFTVQCVALVQRQTQQNAGGMSDTYATHGTYRKSFYTVMMAPSCVKIAAMGDTHQRIHHQIAWAHAVPVIVPERYRKPSANTAATPEA
jgi:hypothetical protein